MLQWSGPTSSLGPIVQRTHGCKKTHHAHILPTISEESQTISHPLNFSHDLSIELASDISLTSVPYKTKRWRRGGTAWDVQWTTNETLTCGNKTLLNSLRNGLKPLSEAKTKNTKKHVICAWLRARNRSWSRRWSHNRRSAAKRKPEPGNRGKNIGDAFLKHVQRDERPPGPLDQSPVRSNIVRTKRISPAMTLLARQRKISDFVVYGWHIIRE